MYRLTHSLLFACLLLGPSTARAQEGPELTLPPMLYGVPGVPLSVYHDNVVLAERAEDYSVEVECDIGKAEKRRWTMTPTEKDVGDHPMEVTVKNGAGQVEASGQMVVRVVPRDSGELRKLRLLIIGDSLTHASHYPNEIARLLSEPANPKWTMLGSHKPAGARPDVAHEGYGGWMWASFLTKWDTNPKADEKRRVRSPFLFEGADGKPSLDLRRYIQEQCHGQPPDVATFLLGINDCFRANPNDSGDVDRTIAGALDNAEKLLKAFRAAAPKTVFAIGLTTPPNVREEAFDANYKGKYTRWGWKRIQHRLVRAMLERFSGREAKGIYVVPTELNIDPIEGFPPDNAVHPNPVGYAQIGATFYCWLKAWLAGEAKPTAAAYDFDVLIRNAKIVDGTGSPASVGDIGIKGRRIAGVGKVAGSARQTIDAGGMIAAPGFIDVHTHAEDLAKIPLAENFLRMGVTTIVTGNCGKSRTDVAKFFAEIEDAEVAINVATLIGHNSVREESMRGRFMRQPNPEQLSRMKAMVDQGMKDGAVGLSTGLIYLPGAFAKTEEVVELAKVAAARGGIYASHMRSETIKIVEALEELIQIARQAKIHAELSHLKLSGPSVWGRAAEVLSLLDEARAEGLSITHDAYAYTASSTGLAQLIPDKAREGTRRDFVARIEDPTLKEAILADMAEMRRRQGRKDYSYAVIARYKADPKLNGKTIPEAAKLRRGSDSLEAQIEMILDIERRGGGSAIYHGMNETDLQAFLKHPLTMIASDGGPRRLGEDVPHPRSYGNNARVLGHYVRDLKLLTLEDAVRRMTSLPAQTFRLKDRGSIRPGAWADLVLFDPQAIRDPATFQDPHHYAEGFTHVLVNGTVVIANGQMSGARPGGPLRMQPMN